MGSQVSFFVTNKDINGLMEAIYNNNGSVIVDSNKKIISLEEMKSINELKYTQCYIQLPNSKIYFYSGTSSLNQIISDIITFSLCIDKPQNDGLFNCARIWYENRYYDEQGNIIEKNNDLNLLFNRIKTYIRKNFCLSVDKGYYMGPDAYEKYLRGEVKPRIGVFDVVFPENTGDGSKPLKKS